VVAALADAVAAVDRPPPVHVAVDGCFLIDLHDPGWPVIRRMSPALAGRLGPEVFLAETRAFFAPRVATWEERFPDDDPAYAAAVAEVGLHAGQIALDAGCGTGRALPHLRAAVGPTGHVLGFDLTPEMLATARRHGRHAHAALALADARPPAAAPRQHRRRLRRRAAAAPSRPRPRPGRAGPGRSPRRPAGPVPPQRPGRPGRPPWPPAARGRPAGPRSSPAAGRRTGWWLARYDDGSDRFLAVAERVSRWP
jgi:SAM-dependent methyltransferase